mmetsp:Transcript_4868/g.9278  ORF Transcript_4868/g.9278 Transcript_4868/m.9278 type:complete len:425 (-) Transcript_4868:1057-2331(-)
MVTITQPQNRRRQGQRYRMGLFLYSSKSVYILCFLSIFWVIGSFVQSKFQKQQYLPSSRHSANVSNSSRNVGYPLKCTLNSFGCIIRPPELTDDIRLDLEEIQQLLGENVALAYGDRNTAGLTMQGSDHSENQDRGIIVSPFVVTMDNKQHDPSFIHGSKHNFLIGIFDGHGTQGHEVSQYLQDHLCPRISMKLSVLDSWSETNIKLILHDAFVEIDKELPEKIGMDGGSTSSIILRIGTKIFFANVGDSLSFLAKYDKKTGSTTIVHQNRFDKPHILEEKVRIEGMGGKVFIPQHPMNSRVVAFNPVRNEMVSLGMSRAIGDWSHGKVGVIAEPIIHALDLVDYDAKDDNLGFFVVAGSDGLFDRRRPQYVAEQYSKCLFGSDQETLSCHPVIKTAELIDSAVPKKSTVYHDDITAMVLRVIT